MRTLLYFIDMLPGDRVNGSSESKALWRILQKMGGVQYTNVFVSGPDTARGLGSFFFEGDLSRNPCRFGSWPGQTNCTSSLAELLKQAPGGYGVLLHNNLHSFPGNVVLPQNIEPGRVTNSQRDFIAWVEASSPIESSFWFVQINDFHYAVDNYGPSNLAFRLGVNSVASHLEALNNLELFDEVIIFSDHGYVRNFSKLRPKELLSDHRTKVFCFHSTPKSRKLESSHQRLMLSDVPRALIRGEVNQLSETPSTRLVEEIRSPSQLDGSKRHQFSTANWRLVDENVYLGMREIEEGKLANSQNKLSDEMRLFLDEVLNSFLDSRKSSSLDACPTVDWRDPLGNLPLPGLFLKRAFQVWSKVSFLVANPSAAIRALMMIPIRLKNQLSS